MSRQPLNLNDDGEWAGEWWVPDEPDRKVPGTLRYSKERGLTLKLNGGFEDLVSTETSPGATDFDLEEDGTWESIHGVAERRIITLLDCVPFKSRRTLDAHFRRPYKQSIAATAALIGVHVGREDEEMFSAVEVSVDNLGVWGGRSVFQRKGRLDDSGTISVKSVDTQTAKDDRAQFILAHSHTLPFFDQCRGGTTGHVRDTTFVRVDRKVPFSWDQAAGIARMVQDLVALATHSATGVIWLRLELADGDADPESTRPRYDRNVEVVYSPSKVGDPDAKAIEARRVFFTCETLPFEKLMPRWCEVHERLRSALNMILGLRYAPADYIENNLLTAVGAAEVLHRGLDIDEPPMPPEEFRSMRESMLAQVPEQYRDHIKRSLRNDPTLRERLLALAARPDQEAMSVLVPDIHRWARRTTQARNDLAHTGCTPHHTFEELIAIVDVTTAVVVMNLLHEVGLSAERQRRIVAEHPQLRATVRRAEEYLWVSKGIHD